MRQTFKPQFIFSVIILVIFQLVPILAQVNLVSAIPSEGSVVHELPSEVQLNMSKDIDLHVSRFRAYGFQTKPNADTHDVAHAFFEGETTLPITSFIEVNTNVLSQGSDTSVRIGLEENLPAGTYVVTWQTYSREFIVQKGFTFFTYQPHEVSEQDMEEHHEENTMQEGHEQGSMMGDDHMQHEGMEGHEHDEMHGQGEMKHDDGEVEMDHHDEGHEHEDEHHQEMKMDHHDEDYEHEDEHHEMKDEHHQEMKMDHHDEGHEHEDEHHEMKEMKDEHHDEEEDHDHDHDEGDSHDHDNMEMIASGGNVFQLGNKTFMLEPLLDISGLFKLALRTPEATYIQLSVTSPSGTEKLMNIQSDTAVFELGEFEEGLWQIVAAVGDNWLETSILAQKQTSDFDSEIVLFLTPAPDLAHGGKTEAFVYGFGDGDNLHKRFTMQTSMQGMAESLESADVDLAHNHFMDMYNSEDFTPMANTTSLDFSLPGLWNIVVNIIGGFSETATFEIKVEN